MKKLLAAAALLFSLIPAAAAGAQGITMTIMLEGEEETFEGTLYHSDLGFSFVYDASRLTVDETMSEDGHSMIIYPTESDLPIYLEFLTEESLGMPVWEFLDENADEDTEYIYDTTDAGYHFVGFVKGSDLCQGFYTIASDQFSLAAILNCPMEAMEGYGHRLTQLMDTLKFDNDPPVSGRLVDEMDPEWLSFEAADDEYALPVLFRASEAVQNFQVLALDFPSISDDGEIDFPSEVLYELPELTPEQPLCVTLTFPGDVPSNGISYVDAEGNVRCFSVSLSGMDGSLVVSEY